MSHGIKQSWIKAASLYWLGCVINLCNGVVRVSSPPTAAEGGGWLKKGESLLLSQRGLLCSHSNKTCSSVSSAPSQRRHKKVDAGEGGGACFKGVGDAAHAHERFGVLEFVEAAGAAVKVGEERVETGLLAPLPLAGAEVGKVLGARAAGATVREARLERRVKGVQHNSGVKRGWCGKGGFPSGMRLGDFGEIATNVLRPFPGRGGEPREGVEPSDSYCWMFSRHFLCDSIQKQLCKQNVGA